MSSLFSDPPFTRGTTLLDGEAVEYSVGSSSTYATAIPYSGAEIVGQIKCFADIHPVTKTRLSNELVYCIAARYKPSASGTTLDCNTNKGRAVVLRNTATNSVDMQSTAEFDGTFATNANVTAGLRVAFLDEYYTGTLRANDVMWLVVKGPATVSKTTGAAVNAGTLVTLTGTAGRVVTASAFTTFTDASPGVTANQQALGIATGSFNAGTNAVVTGANAVNADEFVRTRLYGINWGV